MASAVEAVKEKLVGTEEGVELTAQTRSEFFKHAKKDEETGVYYMDEEGFVDAM
ncbi:hypothetical protein M433DRAFT_150399 [Acidomyces richmondensis BFW]|nr:MAG: hypothetical protein FE78DRAFT_94789 [Acidomyces sp. 'richmondensis']KYG41597.1 hypothetical protein M433DRAFT_158841 [Acidomyces richmondensis BFW]KYG49137.1 hypothetical protein M433DRAFT_150399 [Acidomyces richmondensis BFW]